MLKEYTIDGNLNRDIIVTVISLCFMIVGIAALVFMWQNASVLAASNSLSVVEVSPNSVNNSTENVTAYETLTSKEKTQFRKALAERAEASGESIILHGEPTEPISGSWEGPDYVTLDGNMYEITQITNSGLGFLALVVFFISVVIIVGGGVITLYSCADFVKMLFDVFPKYTALALIFILLCVSCLVFYGILQSFAVPVFEKQTVISDTTETPSTINVINVSTLSEEKQNEFYTKSQSGESLDRIAYQENTYLKSDGEFYKLEKRHTNNSIITGLISVIGGSLSVFWAITLSGYLVVGVVEVYNDSE